MNRLGKSMISKGSFGSRIRNRYASLYDEKHLMGIDPLKNQSRAHRQTDELKGE